MVTQPHLFTIGHSNRSIEEFIGLLLQNQVTAVADVRSQPFSGRFPQFNEEPLKARLRNAGIDYVFLGEELGARRHEVECYVDGQAKYQLIVKTPAFQSGLERIRRRLRKYSIALMCAEKDPLTCHRMILVCPYLKDEFAIMHIIDAAKNETQLQAESRLLEIVGFHSKDLFRSEAELLAEAYETQGDKIAFRSDPLTTSTISHEE